MDTGFGGTPPGVWRPPRALQGRGRAPPRPQRGLSPPARCPPPSRPAAGPPAAPRLAAAWAAESRTAKDCFTRRASLSRFVVSRPGTAFSWADAAIAGERASERAGLLLCGMAAGAFAFGGACTVVVDPSS